MGEGEGQKVKKNSGHHLWMSLPTRILPHSYTYLLHTFSKKQIGNTYIKFLTRIILMSINENKIE